MAALLGAGVTIFAVVHPFFAAAGRDLTVATRPADLPADLVVEVQILHHWVPYTIDPRLIDAPPEQFEVPGAHIIACPTDPAGGPEYAALAEGPGVRHYEPVRRVQAFTPWGVRPTLSFVPGSRFLAAAVEVTAGRLPASPGELALPESMAAGHPVGSTVEFTYLLSGSVAARTGNYQNYLGKVSVERFTVVGTFRPKLDYLEQPVLYLRPSDPNVTRLDGRTVSLETTPPNLLLFDVGGEAGVGPLSAWLTGGRGDGWWDDDGHFHLGSRYPVIGMMSRSSPAALADDIVAMDVTFPAAVVTVLVCLFVGAGALGTMLLSFLDRRRELAILKTVGLGGGAISRLLAAEVVIVGAAGAVLGGLVSVAVSLVFGAAVRAGDLIAAGLGGVAVLLASTALPILLARAATVAQLLTGQALRLIYRRVG